MINRHRSEIIRNFITLTGALILGLIILSHPRTASEGIRNGLNLLYNSLIPALFPFMVISGYVAKSSATDMLSRFMNNHTGKRLYINAYHFLPFILGCLGGYPIGARVITDLRKQGYLSDSEAQQLFCWCINPGAAFVITAVGSFMLGSTASGIIIYSSCMMSSVILGLFNLLFFKEAIPTVPCSAPVKKQENPFIQAVASSVEAMLGICGWVIFFSALCELTTELVANESLCLFINAVAEVTSGCKSTIAAGLSLPVISALISFGGLAVTAQISPDLISCGIKIKAYVCWRIAGGAISALICSALLKAFPQCVAVSTALAPTHTLTQGIPTALIMIFMCIVLIFEVDNKRKVW